MAASSSPFRLTSPSCSKGMVARAPRHPSMRRQTSFGWFRAPTANVQRDSASRPTALIAALSVRRSSSGNIIAAVPGYVEELHFLDDGRAGWGAWHAASLTFVL
jgi:hypothetical protein